MLPRPSPEALPGRRRSQLTGRGAVLVVFGACFTGLLIADWANWQELADAVFFLASSLTAYYVRPGSLLPVVASPPLLFLAACLAVSALTAPGLPATAERIAVTLGGAAWWMVVGMALSVAIALLRGLRAEIRALWSDLRGGQAGP